MNKKRQLKRLPFLFGVWACKCAFFFLYWDKIQREMKIVIIGNGIAGISAARHIRKLSNHEIVVISSETEYFYSRTALMYIYLGQLKFEHTQPYEKAFWAKNRIALLYKQVDLLIPEAQEIQFLRGEKMKYDKLILATGSIPNKYDWETNHCEGVQGLYFYQDLENMEKYSRDLKSAVIVGGGLIGIEMAEMFHSRKIPVIFLVREKSFWNNTLPKEESAMINRHILAQKGIDLRLGEELAEIEADENGRVRAILTKKGEKIACQFVGLTAGVSPNIALAKNTNLEINKGFLVNEFLETNLKNIYATGDCAELCKPAHHRKAIEAVWYTGKNMAAALAQTICGTPTPYQQGIWFNSAKFFDIEYQVYGQISPTPLPEESHLYWEHSDGTKSIRIAYHTENKNVLGFQLMGIRYRQAVCEKWIAEKTSIETVLDELGKANFDPEFFQRYEGELRAQFL